MNSKQHILVVDDDTRLRKLLHRYLNQNGFWVAEAEDPLVAEQLMKSFTFDMIILDVMMPHQNGIEFAHTLRKKQIKTPIMMLTAMGEVDDRIKGLESGVDDYLSKPFEPKELLLRMNNILNRMAFVYEIQSKHILKLGTCTYDITQKTLFCKDVPISLTPTESDLLYLLAQQTGQELSRQELAQRTLNQNERTIDVQINRLRKKIETDIKNPKYLQTIRGKGYILMTD